MRHISICLHNDGNFAQAISRGLAAYVRTRPDWSLRIHPLTEGGLRAALKGWRGDGVICALTNLQDHGIASRLAIPVVNVSGLLEHPTVPTVTGDDREVGRQAAGHFLERGFRNAVVLGWMEAHYARLRAEGFTSDFSRGGGEVHTPFDLADLMAHPWSAQMRRLGRWLLAMPHPLAVFAIFDPLAQLVIEACHLSGLVVPDEVAVLGVDNRADFCEPSTPPLSSVDPAIDRRGCRAAELLADLMEGARPPQGPIRVPPDGVVTRQSTDILATDDRAVRDAVRWIREHAGEHVQVADVVRASRMSRRNLERRFGAALGRTVYEHIRQVRLDTARGLLAGTDKTVLAVALESGFLSASDLANAFRRHLGITPGQFRRRAAMAGR